MNYLPDDLSAYICGVENDYTVADFDEYCAVKKDAKHLKRCLQGVKGTFLEMFDYDEDAAQAEFEDYLESIYLDPERPIEVSLALAYLALEYPALEYPVF